MGEGDDEIGTFLLHPGDVGPGGFDDVAGADLAGEVVGIPGHDLGRQEADEADLDGGRGAGAVGELLFDDLVGGDVGGVAQRIGGEFALDQIGRDEGKVGAGEGGVEEVEAVVELVIAQRADLIAERVHGGDGGVRLVGEAALIGDIVAERVALDHVAIVDEYGVAGFGADRLDERGGAGEAHGVVGGVGEIIIRIDRNVQIGGLDQPEVGLIRLRLHREGMHDDKRTGTGRTGKEGTPREAGIEIHVVLPV